MYGLISSQCRLLTQASGACSCSSTLITPATPAASSRWPMFVFTEPRPQCASPDMACAVAVCSAYSPLERALQSVDLDRIAQRRAGAVRFDVARRCADRCRLPCTRPCISSACALRIRRRQRVGATAVILGAAADHSIDVIAIALGGAAAASAQHADAFAAHVAVGVARRRSCSGRLRTACRPC